MAARVTLFCGNTQQGKSTLALKMALREWPRVIVLDSARSKVFNAIAPGGQFTDWPSLARWLLKEGNALPRWCIALRSKSPEDYAATLRCAEHMRGILILCDETHKLCRMEGVQLPLELCALTGAHYGGGSGVGLYMVAQRPGSVPINIRSQAERVITFRQREPRDIAWLTEWSGSEEWAAGIAGLADHCHTTWPADITVRKGNDNEVAENGAVRGSGRSGERSSGPDVPGDVREIRLGVVHPESREVNTEPAGAVSAHGSDNAPAHSAGVSTSTVES